MPTAPYLAIETASDLAGDLSAYLPGILKTARLGYDGKGQRRVVTCDDARSAFSEMGGAACVLEKMLELKLEVSAIVARTSPAQVEVFPVAENQHRDGILDVSIVPARIDAAQAEMVRKMACQLAETLNYIGVLAVEFFVLEDNSLVVNEIAPRPHNSGHYTLDACVTDQYQQQVRTLCGLLPGSPTLLSPVVMVNILGTIWPESAGEPHWNVLVEAPNAHLHLYGKRQARPGRKMGHFTVVSPSVDRALEQALALRETL